MNKKDYGEIFCKGKNVSLNATQSYYEGGGRTLGDLLDLVYPIGSIYMNVNNINPQSIFGGSWQKIEGRFLLGSSSSYSLGVTGGEASHIITYGEMPTHSHDFHGGSALFTRLDQPIKGIGGGGYWAEGLGTTSDTGVAGSSQAHNNMPPYLVVNIWKRVA